LTLRVAEAITPKELAQDCDFVVISVTNFAAVKELCFGKEGIIACSCKDFVVADTSTIFLKNQSFAPSVFQMPILR
jgi:3-hydroxyisobutyrate dehydrogenase-like beta-hydroxyacid dehydrogenase